MEMTDRCRALRPLGAMPKLRKLTLSHFGFDDVDTLISCLNPRLQVLDVDYACVGTMGGWTCSDDVDAFVQGLSRLTELGSLSVDAIPLTDSHLISLLPQLKFLRCLDISGFFGRGDESPLTDHGMKAIADHCPNVLSLSVDYQGKVTYYGILSILQSCTEMVELRALSVNISVEHATEILAASSNLHAFAFGTGFNERETCLLRNAVSSTNGRVVLSTAYDGILKLDLSEEHKSNQDASLEKLNRAHEQHLDPIVTNKWDGIL